MENPGRKEGMPRKKGIREGRKEGERKEARKEGRKITKKEQTTPTPSTLIQVIRIILLLIIIIIVRPQYSNYIKRRQMPKALRKVASSIFAPAKTEPIWTLSEPVIKVFAPPPFFYAMQAGFRRPRTRVKDVWGGLPPPTPALFLRNAGCLSRKSHHQQDLRQTRSRYGVVLSHHTGCLFANEGLRSRQHPRVIFKLQCGLVLAR